MGAKSCFVAVNSDPAYRAKFINDPIGTLKSEGISLSATDQAQLLATIQTIKSSLPNLAQLPTGYQTVINAVGGQAKPGITGAGEVGVLIV